MKRTLILLVIVAMVMALAVSAQARFIIKAESQTLGGGNSSGAGNIDNGTAAKTATNMAPLAPVAAYGIYDGIAGIDGTLYAHYKVLDLAGPTWTYYGKVINLSGAQGQIDLRFGCTSTASMMPLGTWYLYKGLVGVGTAETISFKDSATFATTQTTWALSQLGGVFNSGEFFTLTNQEYDPEPPQTPEPGSIIAVLTGLVGLVGIRRRK